VYGYVTTGTFDTDGLIEGSGSGSDFTPTLVTDNDPPLWYDWTKYPGNSGSMPSTAYLGCLYRGRCVLSGNPDYPYQWYMSRQADPWDWYHVANDAQSPVAGQDAEAGLIGDIIRSLISWRDEYLIFGCANSIWVMRGDPADGGTLDCLDAAVGMFGSRSWCFDGVGNLYFLSKDSICRIPQGLGGVENLSGLVLPKLVQDAALDPTLYRVCMAYDRDKNGILITFTLLSDGSNECYWFDLKTNGFFRESYDSSCGPYSLFYYEANDDSLRRLLVGSTDGYMRNFDDSTKNDTTTNSTSTIDSYTTLPIINAEDDDRNVKMSSLTVTVAGGAAEGAESDSDAVDVELYVGEDSETVLEAIEDGDTAWSTTTLTGPGRANRIRNRAKGHSIAVRLRNSTASQTWAVEKVSADIKQVGKVK